MYLPMPAGAPPGVGGRETTLKVTELTGWHSQCSQLGVSQGSGIMALVQPRAFALSLLPKIGT